MAGRQYQQVAYGLSQALIPENPSPVIAKRNPTASDFAFPTTIWTNTVTNAIYILASVSNNSANWVLMEAGGGAGNFASLTVTPGPISLTGTTTINTAGASNTTIGTGGTGAVNIGNATGNTSVTGTLTTSGHIGVTAGGLTVTAGGLTVSAGNIVATTGNITATAGSVSAGTTVTAGTGITATTGNVTATNGNVVLGTAGNEINMTTATTTVQIVCGDADPTTGGGVAAHKGSLYLYTAGSGTGNRLWVNVDGTATGWTAVTTAA